MVRKFVERLIAEFNGTKADLRVALGPGRMKLPHCKYRFPITMLIKGDDHPEPARIVVLISAVIHLQKLRSFHLQEYHSIVISSPIGGDEDKTPATTEANFNFLRLNFEPRGTEPMWQMFRIGPRLEHETSWRRNNTL